MMKKLFYLCLSLLSCSQPAEVKLEKLESPTSSLLQAISIVDESTLWVSGHDATLLASQDKGSSWQMYRYPFADTLQFRDVHGFDAHKAILMSSGPGKASQLITFQAPDQWEEHFIMDHPDGFLDCMAFWDDQNGIAYGDAIDGYPYILLTKNGGKTWIRADTTQMSPAGTGEGGFAASGTCVTVGKGGKAWVATGAGGNTRLLLTLDYGLTWKAVSSPLVKGEAAGHTAVSFAGDTGWVVGGDLSKPEAYTANAAFSFDGGNHWSLTQRPITKGAFYGGALTETKHTLFAFACGPQGMDYTRDQGKTWQNLDTLNYWALSFQEDVGYACGTNGKISRLHIK